MSKLEQIKTLYAELIKMKIPEMKIRDEMIKAVGTSTQLLMLSDKELDVVIDRLLILKLKKTRL